MNCSNNLTQGVYNIQYSFTTAGLKDQYLCKFDVKCHLSADWGKCYSSIRMNTLVREKQQQQQHTAQAPPAL